MKMLGAGFKKIHVVAGLLVVLFISIGSICEPNPYPNQPYTLKIYHQSDQQPWKTVHSGGWLNIHAAELCDELGFVDCHDPAPVCTNRPPGELYQVSVNDTMELVSRQWKRDRIAFFNDWPGFYWNPPFDPADPPSIFAGYWRYWEGEGESNKFSPFGFGAAGDGVALVRRYQRGECSTAKYGFLELLSDEVRDNVAKSMTCPRTSLCWGERAVESATVTDQGTFQMFNTEECYFWDSENKDYIELYNKFIVAPNHVCGLLANAVFQVETVMWFRLVSASRRSAYLDCPRPENCDPENCFDGEGCKEMVWDAGKAKYVMKSGCGKCDDDCQTVTCDQASDCCDLPGVVCMKNEAGAVTNVYGAECFQRKCTKRNFLDVKDYGFDYGVNYMFGGGAGDPCWSSIYCKGVMSQVESALAKLKSDPYRYVYAPLLQAMYDQTWTKTIEEKYPPLPPNEQPARCGTEINDIICDFFRCTSDDDCHRSVGYPGLYSADKNFDSRCNAQGFCEIRPMQIYHVNQYPNAMEFVLAWNSGAKEYNLYSLADSNAQSQQSGDVPPELMCKSLGPDDEGYGWSTLMSFGGAFDDGDVTHR